MVKKCPKTFNSLYEIHKNDKKRLHTHNSPLSILFMRFFSLSSFLPTGHKFSFNSLYEILLNLSVI